MTSKVAQVKTWFENPTKYLVPRQFDIRIRMETVQQFTQNLTFDRVLDIGCGDGSISLPLLDRAQRITLLDISSRMLEMARSHVPVVRSDDVDIINMSFLESNLEPESFDLILCIGVLAHVDSPAGFIGEIERVAKHGALIILEFTDSKHFWGLPDEVYLRILSLLRPEPYALNRLSNRGVLQLCHERGLNPVDLYRYGLPPVGIHTIVNQETMYSITRYLFGSPSDNRNGWMGNEFIYCLKKINKQCCISRAAKPHHCDGVQKAKRVRYPAPDKGR